MKTKMSSASSVTPRTLKFRRVTNKAFAPFRASPGAAGYDLSCAYDYIIPPGDKCLCETDLQIAIPDDCYGRIAARSGLANQYMIAIGAGIVDCDFRGSLQILIFNHGREEFRIKAGDRVAQLVLQRIRTPDLEEVFSFGETTRGQCGFGSTGLTNGPVCL